MEAREESDLTADFVATRLLADEKRRQELSNGSKQGTAETAYIGTSSGKTSDSKGSEGKRCKFCKRRRHTEDTCWRKHGYPEGHPDRPAQGPIGNRAAVSQLNGTTNSSRDEKSSSEDYAFATKLGVRGGAKSNDWFSDSAASGYYCHDRGMFATFHAIPPRDVILGDNRIMKALGCGTIRVESHGDGGTITGTLHDVLDVPDMGVSLSVSKMTERGLERCIMLVETCAIKGMTGNQIPSC